VTTPQELLDAFYARRAALPRCQHGNPESFCPQCAARAAEDVRRAHGDPPSWMPPKGTDWEGTRSKAAEELMLARTAWKQQRRQHQLPPERVYLRTAYFPVPYYPTRSMRLWYPEVKPGQLLVLLEPDDPWPDMLQFEWLNPRGVNEHKAAVAQNWRAIWQVLMDHVHAYGTEPFGLDHGKPCGRCGARVKQGYKCVCGGEP
jgi:hypothetical protein